MNHCLRRLFQWIGTMARIIFYYPFGWVLQKFSLKMILKLAVVQARVWVVFTNKKKKITILNKFEYWKDVLHIKDSSEQMLLDYFATYIFIKMSPLLYSSFAKKNPVELFIIKNKHHIDKALEKQCGAILTTAHFGPAIMTCLWAGRNYKTGLLRLLHNNRSTTFGQKLALRKIRELSDFIPVEYIDVQGDLSRREAILSKNGLIFQSGDGTAITTQIGKLLPVPFLSRQVFFAKGAFSLACRTGAPIVPCFLKCGKEKFEITLYPPVYPDENINKEVWINKAMSVFASNFEMEFFRSPGAWQLWDLFEKGKLIYND